MSFNGSGPVSSTYYADDPRRPPNNQWGSAAQRRQSFIAGDDATGSANAANFNGQPETGQASARPAPYSPSLGQTFSEPPPPTQLRPGSYNPQLYAAAAPPPPTAASNARPHSAYNRPAPQSYNPANYAITNLPWQPNPGLARSDGSRRSLTGRPGATQLPSYPGSPSREAYGSAALNTAQQVAASPPSQYSYSSTDASQSPHSASFSPTFSPPAPPPLPVPPPSNPHLAADRATRPLPRPTAAPKTVTYLAQPTAHAYSAPAVPIASQAQTRPLPQPESSSSAVGPVPPPHRSDTTGRHPQRRPLPGPPSRQDFQVTKPTQPDGLHTRGPRGQYAEQDDLFAEVENAFMHGSASAVPAASDHQSGRTSSQRHRPSGSGQHAVVNGVTTNGTSATAQAKEDSGLDDSDLEAEAGLQAMRAAEEQEAADEARRRSRLARPGSISSAAQANTTQAPKKEDSGSDGDYAANMDVELYGGGFAGHISYGPESPPATIVNVTNIDGRRGSGVPEGSSGHASRRGSTSAGKLLETDSQISPFPSPARVDTSGTGGLAEPGAVAQKVDFDEAEDYPWTEDQFEPPELFYHPGLSQRPLPPPPPPPPLAPPSRPIHGLSAQDLRLLPKSSLEQRLGQTSYEPQGFSQTMSPTTFNSLSGSVQPSVPRSTSLVNHASAPYTLPPIRSKTDAEERRARALQSKAGSLYSNDGTQGNGIVTIDLPSIPAGKRFNPAKLTQADFKKCQLPWALSSVVAWLRTLADGEQDLKEHVIIEGLLALIAHKVPTLNIAEAEAISARIVEEMYQAGVLVHEEEWLKFSDGSVSGVIIQLTGSGCYSSKLHDTETPGRCYSSHCQRTLKKLDLQSEIIQLRSDDWATFYKLKKEDVEGASKTEIERQNILHEVVVTEDGYMEQLNVLQVVYHDAIACSDPPVIAPNRLPSFLKEVFGRIDTIRKASEEYLLPQLKYLQREEGPWIAGCSDIFRDWIRKAKNAYIDYAAAFPRANFLVRHEAERSIPFRMFLEAARSHKLSSKLGWDTYLKAPITRLQRYGLLLSTVHRKTQEGEEKNNLQIALEEIKAVTLECDSIVAEMGRKVALADLQTKLVLRPGMPRVELNLDHLGRQLLFKGDLQRTGANRFAWLDSHALLFDHYLVLAKLVKHKDSAGGDKFVRYDVSRPPIPMDLLILESTDDDPVVKSRSFVGVAGVSRSAPAPESRVTRPGISNDAESTTSVASTVTSGTYTKNSMDTINTTTTSTSLEPNNENLLYPFKIKHLGKDLYTLYAPSAQNRRDWCQKIHEAKAKHAASLYRQNAEPFRLKVIADSAFSYEGGSTGQKSIVTPGTPLDRAIKETEDRYRNAGRPSPVCRAKVNCATAFMQPPRKALFAVGTDFGVFVSELDNPRGWIRAIASGKVTQLAALEDFGLFLVLTDKTLVAYHLDAIPPATDALIANDDLKRAPQKLSGSRDVGFFANGKMKDRALVFYKKRDGISSTFKVLEPVYKKSTEKKIRFGRTGRTEFFREYDDFYIPTECFGMNLFHSSLAISTAKGFEVLTLDKKQTWSIPDLKQAGVSDIASRLTDQIPLGMFRLSEQEFLLCYADCAAYVNKHGDVSRSVIMDFVGQARSAAMFGRYILLFDQDFVEIRNAQNGRLRQVIAGRDVKCLDDGLNGDSGSPRTIKICMQHPFQERYQIIMELILNEGQME